MINCPREFSCTRYEIVLAAGEQGHHGCEWQEDFAGIIRKAEEIKLSANGTRWLDWERYSSRQNTKMKLGGLAGKNLQ